jgi:rare lipoprotein A
MQSRAARFIAARVAVAIALGAGLSACRSRPPTRPDRPPLAITGRAPERGAVQVGMASYYASRFHGRRTANGERYDERALTAAHRTLPFGTVVRVTRLDAGGMPVGPPVVVRINDRGPYSRARIIDLSLAAARRLQMLRAGVVRVQVEVLPGAGRAASS